MGKQPSRQQNAPPDTPRLGPRPLALHLSSAMTNLTSSLAALPSARNGSLPWRPELAPSGAELTTALSGVEPGELFGAVAAECETRLGQMLAGVQAYQAAPRRPRDWAGGENIWQQGTTRLLDYGGDGRPVLFVPSLVNGSEVLDLTPHRGMLGWLRQNGHRPFLVDWGAPGEMEKSFSLTDYVCGRLRAVLDAVREALQSTTTTRPALVGYCMGGNLALALAMQRQSDLSGLALLATPWDFHAAGGQGLVMQTLAPAISNVLDGFGELPVDVLQALFAALDPGLAQRKFRHFATLDQDGDEAAHFVALEDWVNDGVPLAAAVARECLLGWYQRNDPAQGRWLIGDEAVDPARLQLPVLLAIPENDRIVPAASAQALATAIPEADVISPAAGHIGMVVGRRGKSGLWQPISQWLETLE